VTRVRGVRRRSEHDALWLDLVLLIGPHKGLDVTDEELESAWRMHHDEIMGYRRPVGWRPWAWWVFERDEEPPPHEPGAEEIRLAELGELTNEELAAIAERANVARTRVNTPAEHRGPNYFPDRRAIELYERVSAIRKRRGSVGGN
jgi:hypothetical protein